MTNSKDINRNDKYHRNVDSSNGHIEIRGNYTDQLGGIDKEDILDVMGCKTRRDIINLLREEPMFVSEISNELDIGQKAIIEHLRAMEEIGILNSSYKKIFAQSTNNGIAMIVLWMNTMKRLKKLSGTSLLIAIAPTSVK